MALLYTRNTELCLTINMKWAIGRKGKDILLLTKVVRDLSCINILFDIFFYWE